MNKKTKTWVIIATSLLVVGCVTFGGLMYMLNWDFNKLSTSKFETNKFQIQDAFSEISVNINTANINFLPAENDKCTVVCCEQENIEHIVVIKDNTLSINVVDERKWYEYIDIHFQTAKITVYLPLKEYGNLHIKSNTGDVYIETGLHFKNITISENTGDVSNFASADGTVRIKTNTGNISVQNISAENIDLSVSTGAIKVQAVKCNNEFKNKVNTGDFKISDSNCGTLRSTGNTGDISLTNVTVSDSVSIERSTGNIKFDNFDASEISAKTSTGDIKGTLLSEKIFIAKSDTGRVVVPKTTYGGKCELTSDTGSIVIKIK